MKPVSNSFFSARRDVITPIWCGLGFLRQQIIEKIVCALALFCRDPIKQVDIPRGLFCLFLERLHGITNLACPRVNKQIACITNVRTSQVLVMVGRESSAQKEAAPSENQSNRDYQRYDFFFHCCNPIHTLIVLLPFTLYISYRVVS